MAHLDVTQTLDSLGGPAAAIVLTDEEVQTLGEGAKTFPVEVATDSGTWPLRLTRMGGRNLIGLSKAVRSEMGVEIGTEYVWRITRTAAAPPVAVPEDLAAALDQAGARAAFDALAPSRRKELVRQVETAKRPETRQRRVAAAVTAAS